MNVPTISWYPMVPNEALVLKDMIKTELKRRSGQFLTAPASKINLNGVVSLSFDVDSINFLVNPETNRVIAQSHGQTIVEPLLLIKDLGDLRNVVEKETIPNSFDYDKIKAAINQYQSEDYIAPSSSCRSACTGLCVGMCGTTCTSMCNDTCTGCTSTCETGCHTLCTGCKNDCGSNCGFTCSNTCSGTSSGCSDCTAGCTSCSKGCTSCTTFCQGTCTSGCSDGCSGSCKETCKSVASSGNGVSSCNACSSYCDGACGQNCTGMSTTSTSTVKNPGSYCTTCGVSCGANCHKTCSGCIGSCTGYCYRTCGDNCVGCTGNCSSNSMNPAESNSHTSCTDCDWTCSSACNDTCTGSCIGTCDGGCTATCEDENDTTAKDIVNYWYVEKYVYGSLVEVVQTPVNNTSNITLGTVTSGDASDTFAGWSVDPDSTTITFNNPTTYYNRNTTIITQNIDEGTNTLRLYAVFSYTAADTITVNEYSTPKYGFNGSTEGTFEIPLTLGYIDIVCYKAGTNVNKQTTNFLSSTASSAGTGICAQIADVNGNLQVTAFTGGSAIYYKIYNTTLQNKLILTGRGWSGSGGPNGLGYGGAVWIEGKIPTYVTKYRVKR